MARPRSLTPSYRLHKPSGQAVVRINGHDHYLGEHGSPESKERYGALVADYLTTGAVARSEPDASSPAGVTIDEVLAAYWLHIESSGRYVKDGEPTTECGWIVYALRPLSTLFGETSAEGFGPKKFQAVRKWMIDDALANGRRLSRRTVNGRMHRITRMFRWAVSMELVPASVWHGLKAVPGLRRTESASVKETAPVTPVAWCDGEATLAHLGRVVGAMVRLQWFTGMRPGEVCSIRGVDIDRSHDVWVYRPARHKTQHHGRECERLIGPKAQAVIVPFGDRDPRDFLFSPQSSERERNLARRAARNVTLWASHETRYRNEPRRALGECYSSETYRRAVQRACARAGVKSWTPNQLRHARATEVRKRFGLEAAQVVLGHSAAASCEARCRPESTRRRLAWPCRTGRSGCVC